MEISLRGKLKRGAPNSFQSILYKMNFDEAHVLLNEFLEGAKMVFFDE